MAFHLPELPYAKDALAPHMSAETLEYHHGKHHRAYVNKLNELIKGGGYERMTLEEIILKSDGEIFNNAAQTWNHTFFWNCLSPAGGGEPQGPLAEAIRKTFSSFDRFKNRFSETAANIFGSGWVWLVQDGDSLEIVATGNAENPMTRGKEPLLTCDVWEHAYYIDYRNARSKFIESFWHLANWDFVAKNFEMEEAAVTKPKPHPRSLDEAI